MYCQKCGEQIPDTASFCRCCGARNVRQVIVEAASVEESDTVQIPVQLPVQTPVQVPVSLEPQEPAAEIPEPLSAEPQEPAAEIPGPVSLEPQEPAAEIPESVSTEPQEPAAEIPEPLSAEPQMSVAEIPEPAPAEPQRPAVAVMEPVPIVPQMPAAEPAPIVPQMPAAEPAPIVPQMPVAEPVSAPPAEASPPETSGLQKQTDDQPDKKYKRKVKLYMIGTGLLTALVSILLIPCTAAFFVFLFLNALTEKMDFPALGGMEQSIINNFLGSELFAVLLGVVCLLLMLDIILINRRCVRRAFLALGMSLIIVGLISFGLSFAVTYIMDGLTAEWHAVLLPAATAFSQSEMLFGIGWCVIGAALFSIQLCIRALRKKPAIVLRRSKAFPVIMVLLNVIIALAVGAGVFLIASGSAPF